MSDVVPAPSGDGRPGDAAGRWGSLFHQSTDAVFVLNRRRRLRFVNQAWATLTGQPADATLGLFCLPRTKLENPALRALAHTLAPPPEVLRGRAQMVRRPVPPARLGPPWWDIQFVPFADARGLLGLLGRIVPVGQSPAPVRAPGPLSEGLAALRQRAMARFSFGLLESTLPEMQRVASQARAAAQGRTPIWIVGEPGTGKETLARIIHHEGVTRELVFLAIDCAGLQPFLIRNMLFGRTGLADTGRLGTIYLRDPGSMPADLQDEFLEWWLGRDGAPRIIVGMNDAPGSAVTAGRVSAEMVTALAVMEIRIPPLRERLSDLPRLIELVAPGGNFEWAPPARNLLQAYQWPGNLRELRVILAEASGAAEGRAVQPEDLPPRIRSASERAHLLQAGPKLSTSPSLKLSAALEAVERNVIQLALQRALGNQSEAATLLGVPRTQLWRRIKELELQPLQPRAGSPAGSPLKLAPILEAAERNVIRLALERTRGDRTRAAELLGIKPRLLNRRLTELGLEE